MKNIYQKTLQNPVSFEGIGLHSGKKSKITILQAEPNQGIVFKRTDLTINNLIEANYLNVSSAKLCTTLQNIHGTKVSTVEHLLAALYLADIDNAMIEINTGEVPIMDGSAKIFLDVLRKSKKKILPEKRKYLKIEQKVQLVDGNRTISIEPNEDSLEVEFQLNYNNQIIGKQKNKVNFNTDNVEDVSSSRTFCLYQDIEKIKQAGLAKGGSLDNAVVVNDNQVLNKGGLRNEKEFVNHKILDLVGDFLLSGYRILGSVKCYQGGHELTNMFLRKMLKFNLALKEKKTDQSNIAKKLNQVSSTKLAVGA